MRLLHTSDWHLGRTLHGVGLLEAQAAYLDHLVELARDYEVAGVLVAGDVFDRAVPPVEAVHLLGDALRRLSEITQVVMIPGNHDSARRLGYGSALWRERVRFVGMPERVGSPVTITADGDEVDVFAIPYLDPDHARVALADGETPLSRSHQAVIAAAMDRIRRARRAVPAVVMAHAFVVGGESSESERDIRVGGVDAVAAGTFAGANYVALGHLHGPQEITMPDGGALVRYAGSPLAFSFSEKDHTKSTTLVSIEPGGEVTHETIAAPRPRRLSEVSGLLEELLSPAYDENAGDWLRVVVTDPARPEQLVPRVRERFPHALVVLHEPPERERSQVARVVAGSDPLQVAGQFFEYVTGGAPTAAEADVLRGALEDVRLAGSEKGGA